MPLSMIYEEIKNLGLLLGPCPLRSAVNVHDKERKCMFHQDHGHMTNQCLDLKVQVEILMRNNYLDRYRARSLRQEKALNTEE